jgi:hypothetical protein
MRIAAALLALATLAAAPVEDWRSTGADGDTTALIDVANIHNEGALRIVRLKLVNPKIPGDVVTEAAVDCGAKTIELRSINIVKDGKVEKKTFELGQRPSHPVDGASGTELLKLACPR